VQTRTAAADKNGPLPKRAAPPIPPPSSPQKIATLRADDHEAPALAPNARPNKERQLLESKFQPAVLATLDCARKNAGSCANVHAGKIALEIWLTDDSPAVRAQLKALGFDLTQSHATNKMLTGNLPVDKLETLAKLTAIQFVSLPRR
jgi:hypothetical protein